MVAGARGEANVGDGLNVSGLKFLVSGLSCVKRERFWGLRV